MKHTEMSVYSLMGWMGCVRCEKFRCDFVAQTFALVRPVLYRIRKATKRSRMHPMVRNAPKHQFRVQWGGSGAFIAKNSDATSCTKFCTSSDRFVSTFVRQPNGLECTQIVRSAPKRQFRVQWGGSRAFVAENSDANIFTSSARFAPSFVRQPNGPECTQMVLNTPKRQFRVP